MVVVVLQAFVDLGAEKELVAVQAVVHQWFPSDLLARLVA